MNSLDRARRFLANKATKLALTAVPLAALTTIVAPPARAGAIDTFGATASATFSVGTCGVVPTFGSGSCSGGQTAAAGGDPNANWIDFSSTTTLFPNTGGTLKVAITGTGTGSVAANAVIPVSWDFIVSSNNTESPSTSDGINALSENDTANATVTFNIMDGGSTDTFTKSIDNILYGTEVPGSGSITVSGGSVTGYSISLEVDGINQNFDVTIPGGKTLSLNPAGAPEPASGLLGGLGLLGAFLLKRRRKQ